MPSESVNEKALTLIDQRRVRLVLPTRQGDPPGAVILGGEADYAVWFHQDGVACDCYAGTDHLPGEPR